MQKIGLKIGGYITLSALDPQETLIPYGYLHGRKLYVGRYPKISKEDNYSSFHFPVGSVVSDYRNYVKNKQVEVEITVAGEARWYRVEYCEQLSILSEDTCTSMSEMLDESPTDTETAPFRYNPTEDYSEYLETFESRKFGDRCLRWRNCDNTNWILKYHMPPLDMCAIIDISCSDIPKEENIRNAQLIRKVLNEHGYKPYLVAGHWHVGEPPYSAERAYIVNAACGESLEDFKSLIQQCIESTGDTAVSAVVRWPRMSMGCDNVQTGLRCKYDLDTHHSYILSADGKETLLPETNNMESAEKIYSHFIKRRSCPFHFDGMELPGSNMGRFLFRRLGIAYEMPYEQNEGMRHLKITKYQ